jgi:hypothetical protein
MAQLFRENGRLGIVFSKRDFEFEPHDDTAAEWRAKHQESYRALGALERYNSRPVLAPRWLETGLSAPTWTCGCERCCHSTSASSTGR